VADESLLVQDTITLVVQVGGKLRDRITLPAGADQATALAAALASDRVRAALPGEPRQVIYVPNRLLNLVP
jgi:leucyl-tRNA synthetase